MRLKVNVFQFFQRMSGVLGFDAIVPGKEGKAEVGMAGLFDPCEAVFQFLPEACGRPMFDSKAGTFSNNGVITSIETL